jgi:uncharacterized membrane protein YqjE
LGILVAGAAIYKLQFIDRGNHEALWLQIVNSISLIVISIAIFDVAKYLIEQEVFEKKQTWLKDKLASFVSVIFVALLLESLLIVFIASKQDIALLIYPSILIVAVSILLATFGYVFSKDSLQDNI